MLKLLIVFFLAVPMPVAAARRTMESNPWNKRRRCGRNCKVTKQEDYCRRSCRIHRVNTHCIRLFSPPRYISRMFRSSSAWCQ